MFKIDILKYQSIIFTPEKDIVEIPYYDLIKVEAVVKIYINNILFFSDDYFPILEFLYQFECWQNRQSESKFEFNTIESEDNPILSFQVVNQICIFDSIWKLTSELMAVELAEVLNEVKNCKKALLKHINQM